MTDERVISAVVRSSERACLRDFLSESLTWNENVRLRLRYPIVLLRVRIQTNVPFSVSSTNLSTFRSFFINTFFYRRQLSFRGFASTNNEKEKTSDYLETVSSVTTIPIDVKNLR